MQWILLTKARSDDIARRAALCAPFAFLPRLLLCSGLSRASLETMIDRLGCLGHASVDAESLYTKLLKPFNPSEKDLGRPNYSLALRLQSRIAAYERLNSPIAGRKREFSPTFLAWLSGQCKALPTNINAKPKKAVSKTPSVSALRGIVSASSLLTHLNSACSDAEPFELLDTTANPPLYRLTMPGKADDGDTLCINASVDTKLHLHSRIRALLDKGATQKAEKILEQWSQSLEPSARLDIAVQLLRHSWEHSDSEILAVRWIPMLSKSTGSDEFWDVLLLSSPDAKHNRFLDAVAAKCAVCWDGVHLKACVDWSMSTITTSSRCLERLMLLILSCSGLQGSLSPVTFSNYPASEWLNESRCKSLTNLALRAAIDTGNITNSSPCLTVLYITAAGGQDRTHCIANDILQRVPVATETQQDILRVLLLRMYLFRPKWMDTGMSSIRSALTQAATSTPDFVNWSSSTMDDTVNNQLRSLASASEGSCLGRGLAEIARSHPLILLRRIPDIVVMLKADASAGSPYNLGSRVQGHPVHELLEASYGGTVRVVIKHWGLAFTEHLWVSLLDALLLSTPSEVAFKVGMAIGLHSFLGVYLQLLGVQQQLSPHESVSRLKLKVKECLTRFETSCCSEWNRWLGMLIEGNEVRHLLIGLDLFSPQQAIESTQPSAAEEIALQNGGG
jgi:hypothetical protein